MLCYQCWLLHSVQIRDSYSFEFWFVNYRIEELKFYQGENRGCYMKHGTLGHTTSYMTQSGWKVRVLWTFVHAGLSSPSMWILLKIYLLMHMSRSSPTAGRSYPDNPGILREMPSCPNFHQWLYQSHGYSDFLSKHLNFVWLMSASIGGSF